MKYRKKPVVIDAIKLTKDSIAKTLIFMGEDLCFENKVDYEKFHDYCDIVEKNGMKINTLEGVMTANLGDYIIKGGGRRILSM